MSNHSDGHDWRRTQFPVLSLQRRSSETGRKNFRSKRFSRNMERNGGGGGGSEAQKQRAHSAHSRIEEDPDEEWRSRSASGEGRGARSTTRLVNNSIGWKLFGHKLNLS